MGARKEDIIPSMVDERDRRDTPIQDPTLYDYIIVGAGMAGLCTAEMLSRVEGKKVLLLERNRQLSMESSAEQHGWGQFGYLYMNLLDPKVAGACLDNIDILIEHYPLPGNNLRRGPRGELLTIDGMNPNHWYREDSREDGIYYFHEKAIEGIEFHVKEVLPSAHALKDLKDSYILIHGTRDTEAPELYYVGPRGNAKPVPVKDAVQFKKALNKHPELMDEGSSKYLEGKELKELVAKTTGHVPEWAAKLEHAFARQHAIGSAHQTVVTADAGPVQSVDLSAIPKTDTDRSLGGEALISAKKAADKWIKKAAKPGTQLRAKRDLVSEKAGLGIDTDEFLMIQAHDRPMRSTKILRSIHDQFTLQGGVTLTSIDIDAFKQDEEENCTILTGKEGSTFKAKKVIFTAGGGLHKVKDAAVNTVLSPLLVVSPPVCDRNVVILSYDGRKTINHLHHVDPVSNKAYSVIGNGDAVKLDAEQAANEERCREAILTRATEVFPAIAQREEKAVYFGYKTEFQPEDKVEAVRNYHFEFRPVDDSGCVFMGIPGKFTLAPSLAVKILYEMEGITPPRPSIPEALFASAESGNAVSDLFHEEIAGERVPSPDKRIVRNRFFVQKEEVQARGEAGDDLKDPKDTAFQKPT